MRAWSGLIRIATILAPLAILLFWGGSYLLACAEFLANPGVPLKFTYHAPAGNLLITAESYVLNTKTGDLTVLKPRVLNPKGWVLFYADRIDALGLPLSGNDTRRAIVTVSNAYATIQRKLDGKLDIFDYLPKQEGPSGNFPFSVEINHGQIKFLESSGTQRYVQMADLKDLRVDGVGDRWVASGKASLVDVGNLTWSVQNQPDAGVWIRGQTPNLELAKLYRVFRQTPEGRKTKVLEEINADSLIVRGPFEVFVPAKSNVRLQATLQAEAKNFSYGRDYRADRLNFTGQASAKHIRGVLAGTQGGLVAQMDGEVHWQDGFHLDGALQAQARSFSDIPSVLRTQVPKQMSAQGPFAFDGRLSFADSPGWRVNGGVTAASLRSYEETLIRPSVDLDYSPDRTLLATKSGTWRSSNVQGNLALDNQSLALSGSLKLANVNLTGLAKRFQIDRLSGSGDLDMLLTGTTKEPVAHIRVVSANVYRLNANVPSNSGKFTIAATIKEGKVRLDQAYLVTQAGSVSASGTFDLGTQALNFNTVGSGIDLDRLDPDYEGIGRFRATVGGTLTSPKYKGTAELFGLLVRGQPIPIITTTFKGDNRSMLASDLRAIKGASQAQGEITLRFKDQLLGGTFRALGVQLSDFLGDDYLATIDLPDARLSGTLKKPTFNANATAKEIVILGSRIDSAKAVVSFQNNLLQIDGFEAKKGKGTVDGFLSYDLTKKLGQASFAAKDLAAHELLPPDIGGNLQATLTGEGGLTFNESGFRQGSGEGIFADVSISGTKIGGGDWKVSSDGKVIKGDAFLGGLASSLDMTGMRYELGTKGILGNLWVRNAPIPDLLKIAGPYMPQLDPAVSALLAQVEGTIGVSAELGGTLDKINLLNGGFSAESVKVSNHDLGTIKSVFSWESKEWQVNEFKWLSPSVNLEFLGKFVESGDVDISGQIGNLDLNLLSLVDPGLSTLQGRVNSKFSVKGLGSSPQVEATIDNGIAYIGPTVAPKEDQAVDNSASQTTTKPLPEPLTFGTRSNEPLRITNWKDAVGGLTGNLDLGYQKQAATLDFKLPFRFPFDLVPGAPVSANLILQDRSINDFANIDTLIDTRASDGELSGNLKVAGTKEDLTTTGSFELISRKLVFKTAEQTFQDVRASISFGAEELNAKLSGQGSQGGGINLEAKAIIPTLDELLRQFRSGTMDELWASPVSGILTAKDFRGNFKIGENGQAGGLVNADLRLGGDLKQPSITGNVKLAQAAVTMPSEIKPNNQASPWNIPVLLNVNLETTSPAKFKSSTAEMDLNGTGSVQGTIANLDFEALLRVQRGNLKLPTARVTIEPGGTIRPTYSTNNGESTARLDVEMEGKTRVVASKSGQGAQRYDVTLDVRGDLLQDGGLSLTATSDPPELSQDEILALLGQVNLLQGIATGVQRGDAQSQIRDALFGIAVPFLLDPLTSRVASAIGLDYLTLDINPLDGASIYFARTLSKNLVLQGSRQVTQINENFPLRYDLRVAYQLRVGRSGDRKRWNFIAGLDETRPWKIAVEYTFRF